MTRCSRRLGPTRRVREQRDAGFSLVEVLVALFMLTFVSIATASYFLSAIRTTADQSQKQNALALATHALETLRAVPVSQVLAGRSLASVQSLLTAPDIIPLVLQDVVLTDNYDASASALSTALVPVSTTQILEGAAFTVRTAINRCWLSQVAHTCTRIPAVDGVSVVRATVNVTWGPASCGKRCSYSASALIDRQDDPLFNIATSQPIIVTTTPTTAAAGTVAPITLTGVAFANGAVLSAGATAGTFTAVTRVNAKKITASWNVGTTPGAYTMTLTNPDTGSAQGQSMVVLPRTVADCTFSTFNGYYFSAVRANDVPANQGTITILSAPSRGDTLIDSQFGDLYVAYRPDPADAGVASFAITYRITVNGQASAPATLTIKRSSCP